MLQVDYFGNATRIFLEAINVILESRVISDDFNRDETEAQGNEFDSWPLYEW